MDNLKNISNVSANNTVSTVVTEVEEIISDIKASPKDWWTSKLIWANLIAIIISLSAYFGIDLKAHGIDPDALIAAIPTVLAIINIILRKGSSQPISNNVVPPVVSNAATSLARTLTFKN